MLTRKKLLVTALVSVAVLSALRQLIWSSVLALVGVAFLSYYIIDALTKVLFNSMPRQLIEDRDTKAVFITGCDSGFGNQLAYRLDALGFQVFAGCLSVNSEGAQSLKNLCSDRLHLLPVDVTKDDQVASAYLTVSSRLGDRKLWAVVNNAGIATCAEVEWCPVEVYRKVMDVNTLGVVRVTKAFLPLVRESQGRIVIVASLAGRVTFPGFTPYSMSKFAAISFADGLRREMKKWGISVHSIEPTLYRTPISSMEVLFRSLKNVWEQCPDDVQTSYGAEYYENFKQSLEGHLSKAKPEAKIVEVVDDMVDAVAGTEPKHCYVPSMEVQLRARLLVSMPTEMQDFVLDQYSPKTPPAAVVSRRRLPPLKNPYANGRPALQRYMSVPVREKNSPDTLHEVLPEEESAFKF